jgi:hypothetical protein
MGNKIMKKTNLTHGKYLINKMEALVSVIAV